MDYKIVFEQNSTADTVDDVNPRLTTFAAPVNTFAHYAPPLPTVGPRWDWS